MVKTKYMEINRIEFVVTYRCTGRCRHCSVGDHLNCSDGYGHVRAEAARSAIEGLCRMFEVTSVMTFGGEPLLYPDVVCAIHDQARACGVEARQLITNGYFTKEEAVSRQAARSLREAGVSSVLLSVDAFHQESIPLEFVCRFAEHAKQAGIPRVRLHPAWVVDEGHENPYNRRTKDILGKFAGLGLETSGGNNIVMTGNAVENLAGYYDPPNLDLSDSCGSMPYTEPLTRITSLTIAPCGDVMVCGFVIGNIYRQSIADIVLQYDPYANEWMRAVTTGGAAALVELAGRKGVSVDTTRCYCVCDVCRLVTAGN